MKKRLIIIYLLIVSLPLVFVSWLGWRTVSDEQEDNRRRFEAVLSSRLREVDERIQGLLRRQEADLIQMADLASLPVDEIRRTTRKSRLIRQVFLIESGGEMTYPAPGMILSSKEQDFLVRTKGLGLSDGLFQKPAERGARGRASSGWYTWFWEEGLNFIYWQRTDSGILGLEIERVALIADVVAVLPDSDIFEPREPDGRIVLSDVRGSTIYQWGAYQPGEEELPIATIVPAPPLSTWRLAYFSGRVESPGGFFQGGYFSLVSGILVLAAALTGLAVYFFRENSRAIRDAMHKVSFVNQVSHELKTPLTNIRLYAELLEGETAEQDQKARNHIGIIVSESQRLSRLIRNVLTFAGRERNALKLRTEEGVIDEVVAAAVENFRPALEARGVLIELDCKAGETVRFDADILEQIVNNLVSNVEKYAASGKYLGIETESDPEAVRIRVRDRGPGIPPRDRKRVFLPFARLGDRLTDDITGTGIGLAIARDLAQLHGGKLDLVPSDKGAVFQLTLPVSNLDGPENSAGD